MIAVGVVVGLGVVMALSIIGMATSVRRISETAVAKTAEAVLASAGVENGTDVSLAATFFDQKADECVNLYDFGAEKAVRGRQFEWASCGYDYSALEQGLVEYELSEEHLPVATGVGKLLANRGLTDFARWFIATEGVNKEYAGTVALKYTAEEGAKFTFWDEEFYPLEMTELSAGDKVNKDGKNHLFTMILNIPFTVAADGAERFEITADDDTFVYLGEKLVLDMGGIHGATMGRLIISEAGEVYSGVGSEELAFSGVKVNADEGKILRIFHADRDAKSSVFGLELMNMKLNVERTQLAGKTGVSVAYNEADPSYVGPLGESAVFLPDNTRGYVIMATVLGVAVVALAVLIMMGLRRLLKR